MTAPLAHPRAKRQTKPEPLRVWLTTGQAAPIADKSQTTIWRWICDGRVPAEHLRYRGKRAFVSREWAEAVP